MKNIIIMCGIPGGGKSTWIRNNVPTLNTVVCSADHFFEDANGNYNWQPDLLYPAHKTCYRKFMAALKDETVENIVVDNTNVKRASMRDYVEAANIHNIPVKIVALLADPDLAASRNVHNVPLETVRKMDAQLRNTLKIGFPAEWKISHRVEVVST